MQNKNIKRPEVKRKRNLSLGPKYKIQVPSFQFEQADNEEKIVDNILDAHRKNKLDIIQLGKGIRDTKKLPQLKQKQIFKNSNQQQNQDILNQEPYDVKELTKQACQVFGTRKNKTQVHVTQNLNSSIKNTNITNNSLRNISQQQNSQQQQQHGQQILQNAIQRHNDKIQLKSQQQLPSQKLNRSKRGSSHQIQSTNNNNIMQLSPIKKGNQRYFGNQDFESNQNSLINKNNKYLQPQFVSKEYLSNNILSNSVIEQQQLQQQQDTSNNQNDNDEELENPEEQKEFYEKITVQRKSPSKGGKVENVNIANINNSITKNQSSTEFNEFKKSNFKEKGHDCQKTLKKYDIYDEEKTPQEWLEYYKDKKGPHGICPIYINKEYHWTDVDLLGYDPSTQKYQVKLLKDNSIKHVVRLSLMFNIENRETFMSRVGRAKILQFNAEDEMKFLKYVQNQPDSLASGISEEQLDKIKNKLITCKHHLSEDQLQNKELVEKLKTQEDVAYTQYQQEKLLYELIEKVKEEYILFQKKSKIVNEMGDKALQKKYKQLQIKNRYREKVIPYYGTIEQLSYPYDNNKENVNKNLVLFDHNLVIKTIHIVKERAYQIRDFKFFNYRFRKEDLPLDLDEYKDQQLKYNKQAMKQFDMQWREYLISEVQERLKNVYNFYLFKREEYNGSHLQKLLQYLDFQVNTYMRECFIKNSVDMYCNFIKNFSRPQQDNQYLNGLWQINSYPLISINLVVNKDWKKKKTSKSKDKKNQEENNNNNEQQQQDEPIFFEPSLEQIEQVLLEPFKILVDSCNSFQCLEKELVPLVNTDKTTQLSYELNQQNSVIQSGIKRIQSFLEQGFINPKEILKKFQKYNFLFEQSVSHIVRKIFPSEHHKESPNIMELDPITTEQKLAAYVKAKREILMYTCVNFKNDQILQIRTEKAKEILAQKCQEYIQAILIKIQDICGDNCERISQSYLDIENKLKIIPQNEKEMVELQTTVTENEVNLSKLNLEVLAVVEFLNILDKYNHSFDQKKSQVFWYLKSRPAEIQSIVGDAKHVAGKSEEKFMEILENEKSEFLIEVKEIQGELLQVKQFHDYTKVKQCAQVVMSLMDRIQQAKKKVQNFNEREHIFKQVLSEYQELKKIINDFDPYHHLWETAIEFDVDKDGWMNGSILSNNYTQIEKKLNQHYYKQATQLIKLFNNQLEDFDTGDVAKALKADIEQFRENLWIIELLTTEAMVNIKKAQGHWKELFQKMGVTVEMNDEVSLQSLLNINIQDYRDTIEEISNKAGKQFAIEKKIKEMEEKVRKQLVELMPFKNTGTHIFKSIDDISQLLDDQLNVILMLKASPYAKPLIKQILSLENRTILIIDTLDESLKCQRSWMYLEPIFSSDDIRKKLPDEKRLFDRVDMYWRETMMIFEKDQSLWENIDNEKMKNDFKAHNKTLETIQKSLSEYLETKRRYFPRFYFLSDEELLEILADTKDPLKVQKHINKCFEAISALDFSRDQEVIGMISAEKEKVKFQKSIDVNEGERKGNVEIWLLEIEQQMQQTLTQMMKQCMQDQSDRNEWLQNWPGQLILAVDMIRWTNSAEVALHNTKTGQQDKQDWNNQSYQNIKEYRELLEKQLQDVVQLVRTDLPDLARLTLGALVTLDVHAKDVIVELEDKNCSDMHDFMWISQLRYEWEENKRETNLWVKMINAVIKYGFEYLGNSPRLVITPLTDRCYRTLMGAKHLQYGGAPEGPAGTGKTETVKDLAKALAVQCVVFNCSDGLNYLAMRKFFKGLASSGAWCCFDEFNRIDLEVLSVIAQQVLTIQEAIKEKRKMFTFDDEDIPLISSCAVNITMNPGYAGRSELPDNLKALFRPCAMMVPDYALIAEIYLYSVGFTDARNLARKVVASLRLSSEQLSSQDHYDFGMRAVKAILTAAGNLKRTMQNEIEDIVCLRALMDVNLPKFTMNDVPLFMSITSDLFPNVKVPESDYGLLQKGLIESCEKHDLIPLQNFLTKCIQLYDTINVRHGLMLVGQAYSGKTSILKTLQRAITSLKGQENFTSVQIKQLNPKGVTSDQLFGRLDPDTKQWSDGVVAIIMRECAQQINQKEKKWIVFDGPVDAVWIENMNTVLDDNKKLCLTSGEIIRMTSQMTMMFEVEDLAVASPATVSRCGMVFLETQSLGFEALIQSFVNQLPLQLDLIKDRIVEILKWLIDCSLAWGQKYGNFLIHKNYMAMVATCLRYFETYLKPFREEIQLKDEDQIIKENKEKIDVYENLILFCVVWGIGGAMEEKSRKQFDEFLKHLIHGDASIPQEYKIELFLTFEFQPQVIKATLPEKKYLFELSFDKETKKWTEWIGTQGKYMIPEGGQFQDIFVPTSDSIRNNFFLNLCIQNQIHLLLCGPTGTGKTANILKEINEKYMNTEYTNLCTAFSGQTNVNQVQQLIESKVSTRKKKGVFGPEEGKLHCVIFIDDLNMPQKETYGAQPPIELLRQLKDTKQVYDLETKELKHLVDTIFVAAMLPQGNQITMRYLRHYNTLYAEPFEQNSLVRIFSNIIEWYFISQENPVPNVIKNLKDRVVQCTIDLYHNIQNSEELLPTPAKSHYLYNLRDISKVFQGISKATYESYKDEDDFVKLWIHECQRVFQDRLINEKDHQTFQDMLQDIVLHKFSKNLNDLTGGIPLLFASFIPFLYPGGDTSKPRLEDVYCEIKDHKEAQKKIQEYLNEYNSVYSSNRMNLVLFMAAIQHVVKIVRVITTTYGHCLLVGVGGSGRKSLATLSSFIATQSEPFIIDQNNWVEEMQNVMKMAGLEEKETIFLFSDTQIQQENNVEEICNILNNGEIPNLFPMEDKAKIIEEIQANGTPNEKYNMFVQQCRKNLHMVLAFSPVGESFRRRLRTFPTLVNCTTIDWFLPWPQEALRNTASMHFVKEMEIEDVVLRNGLQEVAVDMQTRVSNLTQKYLQELRRYYYVTPTSYLELLSTFKTLVKNREYFMNNQIKRYETGVKKIVETESVIEIMQKELEDLQPLLQEKTEKNKILMKELQVQQKQADGEREICEIEEQTCNVQRDEANAMRQDCQKELDQVIPLLDGAAKALERITKDDMITLKSFVKPPEAAGIVMEGMCYAFNEDQHVKLVAKKDSKTNEKIKDFWEYSKKKLLNDKLLKRVMDFREDQIRAIPKQKVEKLVKFMENPLLEKEKVFNASKAAGNLSMWLRAVVDTNHALLVVDPKKRELEEAEGKLKLAEENLKEKKDALAKIMAELQKLQQNFDEAQKEKQELQTKVDTCQLQLERAEKLINGLASEKDSWAVKADSYKNQLNTVIGDCMLSSGIIAYMGAFPIAYREETLTIWKDLLKKLNIPFSENFSLANTLSDPIEIGQWTNQYKLPNDSFSIDNAIILKNSYRFPLMIDPQQQASTWVKKKEANRQMIILRPSQNQKDLSLKLENSIQLGFPVLLENLSEQIDQIFEPILQKKMVKIGGSYKMKFGEKLIDYSKDFMFYMTTKHPKPHYPPEICVKVTLLNFQVTVEGLEDQMLNIVVQQEEPLKDKQRSQNIEEYFMYKNQQKNTENLILKLLNESEGNLLDDDELIQTLETSKVESKEIEDALQKQEHFSHIFNNIRENYRPVAKRSSNMYFVILDLGLIEPTYQWSLDYYIDLFLRSIQKAEQSKEHRVQNIVKTFQSILYDNICRSLLEKDKLIFSFMQCLKILEVDQKISKKEIRFLAVGGTSAEVSREMPDIATDWLSYKQWCTLVEMETNIPEIYENFIDDFVKDIAAWEILYNNPNNYEEKWPGKWNDIPYFQKLPIIRTLFSDKFSPAINKLVVEEMGEEFISPPPFNLQQSADDSTPFNPLVFVLSPGADPRLEILQLAEVYNKQNTFAQISLGQGQGELAEKSIKQAAQEGSWVLLQNCHLAPSFMPELERILENMELKPEDVNDDFRIWLTTMPSEVFPPSILMKSIKMTFEPPRGLRNNLLRSFSGIDRKYFESSQKPEQWKKLFFGLAFFHAIIIERKKFGPLGWNIPYEYTIADFNISYSQLKMFLDEYENIPWEALNYMVAEANYGGRVTDPMDRRLIKIILQDFYDERILSDDYKFSPSGIYHAPQFGNLQENKDFISELPRFEETEIFGLHSNAAITFANIETNHICDTVLSLLPRETSGKGQQPEDIIQDKISSMLQKLPPLFDIERANKLHPVRYEDSMNTVLQQELIRFNKLLKTVVNSLKNLSKAIKGLMVMSPDLEKLFNSIFDNKIPEMWSKVSYPSLKNLGSYLNDLVERLNYMSKWVEEGAPTNFWISGFYFTQSFLTGTMQNFARKYQLPIDTLQFKFHVISEEDQNFNVHEAPQDGCYIHGLFLEGAKWGEQQGYLQESVPKQLYTKMPYIQLMPTANKLETQISNKVYNCPVYKTSQRRGTLSTTGHSTNFVLSMLLSISETDTPEHWVKRGVAMLTQLDD